MRRPWMGWMWAPVCLVIGLAIGCEEDKVRRPPRRPPPPPPAPAPAAPAPAPVAPAPPPAAPAPPPPGLRAQCMQMRQSAAAIRAALQPPRPAVLNKEARDLAQAASTLSSFGPRAPRSPAPGPSFHDLAVRAAGQAHQVSQAIHAGQYPRAGAELRNLEETCNACHARFR